jgi:hypothetical protein
VSSVETPFAPSQAVESASAEAPVSVRAATSQGHWPTGVGQPSDPVEVALAKAIEGASEAKEWATVAQLARELEARRAARAGNVMPFDAKRRQRGP